MELPTFEVDVLVDLAARGALSQIVGQPRGTSAVVVDLGDVDDAPRSNSLTAARFELASLPAVLIGVGSPGNHGAAVVDVVVESAAAAAEVAEHVHGHPLAAVALAMLLRNDDGRTIPAGLVAESSTYSMLQAGPEFTSWRARRRGAPPAEPRDDGDVRIQFDGPVITVTLDRPSRHNALNTHMLERLVDVLTETVQRAFAEPAITVVLRGAGPSFSSGGDVDEFGQFPDPASAHVIRLSRSAGRLLAMIGDRTEARLHGYCLGAGVELPAFARTITADADTTFGLPEIELGLIPGAGGTVSLPRRIGRHRTALLAITGRRIDTVTALEWGLVDDVSRALALE